MQGGAGEGRVQGRGSGEGVDFFIKCLVDKHRISAAVIRCKIAAHEARIFLKSTILCLLCFEREKGRVSINHASI